MPTTASEWLAEHSDDLSMLEGLVADAGLPVRTLTELPTWMKERIVKHLQESFAQDYWDDISLATAGDAEAFLTQGLQEGWSIRRMATEMANSFMGDTQQYALRRSTLIARTESGNALNGARREALDGLSEMLGSDVPMKLTWLSVLGTTTRATHAMLDGVPADEDGLWELGGVRVPWPGHWSLPAGERCNCFPAGTLVSGSFNGAYRARYDGIVAEIVTMGGIRLTVTPYHPILTLDGFLPACKLKPGQKVVAHRLQVDDLVGLAAGKVSGHAGIDFGDKEQDEPVAIEKVFEAFRSAVVSVEVKRADVDDFYGDGQFMPGEIEIVRPDWKLLSDGVSRLFEKRGDFIFALMDGELSEVSGLGSGGLALGRVNIAPSSCPSLANPSLSIPIGCVTPTGSLAVGIAADFNPSFSKSSAKNRTAVIAFLRNALKGDTGLVSLDEVVEVRYFESSCHVYDLQSECGVIVASGSLYTDNAQSKIGLVVGNCQCSLTSEMGMMGPEARQLIQDYNDRLSEYEEAAGEVWVKGDLPGHPFRGNQWVGGGGGGTAVEEGEPVQAGMLSDWEKADYREQLDYWEGYRGTIAQHALQALSKPGAEDGLYGMVKKDWRGGVQAIVCMTRNPSKIIIGTPNDGTYLKVDWFATKEPGHGREVFGKIVERAVEMNSGIALESAPSAEGFYRKMGMVDTGRQFFYMTPEQCKAWPAGSKDWQDDEEPEDGVFAVASGELEKDEGESKRENNSEQQ